MDTHSLVRQELSVCVTPEPQPPRYRKLLMLALTQYGCCDDLMRYSVQRLGTEPGTQGALRKW